MRRVVVTGMGAVTPLGVGVDHTWDQLIKGESGLINVDVGFDLPAKVAAKVPRGSKADNKFDPEEWGVTTSEAKRLEDFIIFAIAAAAQAIEQSGIDKLSDEVKENIGVSIGSGIGGLERISLASNYLYGNEYRKISPFFIPSVIINLAAGQVSIRHGFTGPNLSMVTACSTGAHSIGDAFWLIRNNVTDVMVTGGAEASIVPVGLAGFSRMNALSTNFNDQPTKASRPWDKDRDGFVMGEGAGVLVLEELEHAQKRGANILAEIVGFGMSGDAHHITAPSPEGKGALLCMQRALKDAQIEPDKIDYINAHGTSTPLGDEIEIRAMKKLFKDHINKISVSSTKSAIGHLLGAAGAVESVFAIKSTINNIVPPTLNLDNPSEGCDIDLVPHKSKEKEVNYVLSNSFGFGGTNAALIFKKYKK